MWTGQNLFNVTSVPGGTLVQGPQGEWLKYNFANQGNSTNPDWVLTQWNSSKMFTGSGFSSGTGLSPAADQTTTTSTNWAWQNTTIYVNNVPQIQSQNVTSSTTTRSVIAQQSKRYDPIGANGAQNLSLPWRNSQPSSFSFSVLAFHYGDIIICRNGSYSSLSGVTQNDTNGVNGVSLTSANWTYFAINMNASNGAVGSILWWSPTYTQKQDRTITWGGDDPVARVFVDSCKETYNFVGYSMADGSKLWETNDPAVNAVTQNEITTLDYFGNPAYPYVATQPANGKLFAG